MRPYPQRNLNNKKRIFNYRLSRGRKNIECTFGMLTQKFQVLLTPIRCRKYENIISIVNCACILHNFILESANSGLPRNIPNIQADILNITQRSSPVMLCDYLANYFLKPNVALPWQWNYCSNNNEF
ncbi:hypothetical protein J437_LFUL011965 [Ladona fulva]|uniref:DDE Tnp4 domain-containing protein n=1 Tax=Ladona fulva TaxID=123851 RepID=A0A8K0P3F0_LADFU|nr:hypothetical protein J437_LFUL011965 [Ladona fulva]